MRDDFLPFTAPFIGDEEVREIVETLTSGWLTTGPKTQRFEDEFREYVGAPGALSLNSCTAGLHSALIAHQIGPGDEVITTPMTFAASVNVIEHVGARPVLVDVEPDTLNICPQQTEDAVTPQTKAIIPVHLAGHPAELDSIHDIARRRNLIVIEDAAHAVAARYKGRAIGSGDNPVAFSFYATKNLTTGEGGMLTGDPDFLGRARVISLHGMSREAWSRYVGDGSWLYDIVTPGFKYNMTDLQASLGIWQLKRLDDVQRRRREIVQLYQQAFASVEQLELPVERPEVEHAWHLYSVRLRRNTTSTNRDALARELYQRGIGTSVHFIPVHLHSWYRNRYGWRAHDFPVAFDSFCRILSLPLGPRMSDDDAGRVIESVLDIVAPGQRIRLAA